MEESITINTTLTYDEEKDESYVSFNMKKPMKKEELIDFFEIVLESLKE